MEIRCLLRKMQTIPPNPDYQFIYEGAAQEAVERGNTIMESWRILAHGDTTENQELLSYQRLLRKGYEDYQKLFAEQERMRVNGSFFMFGWHRNC